MARDAGQIEQEIKGLRQEITGRVDNLKERAGTDRQDAIDGVKSLVSKSGVEDGMQERPYIYLGGALAAGVVAGLASGMVQLPLPRVGSSTNGDRAESQQQAGSGILASLVASAEAVAFTEGKDAVKSWLRSRNGHETGPDPVTETDNDLGTSVPPPAPVA